VDNVAASTNCCDCGESMWPAKMMHVNPGRNSSPVVSTYTTIQHPTHLSKSSDVGAFLELQRTIG